MVSAKRKGKITKFELLLCILVMKHRHPLPRLSRMVKVQFTRHILKSPNLLLFPITHMRTFQHLKFIAFYLPSAKEEKKKGNFLLSQENYLFSLKWHKKLWAYMDKSWTRKRRICRLNMLTMLLWYFYFLNFSCLLALKS